MKQFETKEEAFASQNYNPDAVVITGVPAHHVEAAKAVLNLFVLHDAVNPDFQPDYDDSSQRKYENVFEPGSPSGSRFSFYDCADWYSISVVGSRLVSESGEAARHIAEIGHDDYKALMVYERKIE